MNKIKRWWLKRLLERAVKQNLLVFDEGGKDGIITDHLLFLIKCIAHHNYGHIVYKFYVPESAKIENVGINDKFHIIPTKALDRSGELFKHYKDMGGSLAKDNKGLILGVSRLGRTVIIGSF